MDQSALKNINTLLDINENTTFIFNDNKELIINDDDTNEHVNNNLVVEYTLYFTYNQVFNMLRSNNTTKTKNIMLSELNESINNLYDNVYFLTLLDNNKALDETMNDICLKLDVITEKYQNECTCNDKMYNLFEYLTSEFRTNLPRYV